MTTTYLLRDVPVTLWRRVRSRAARDGRSVRGILLDLLEYYATRGLPVLFIALLTACGSSPTAPATVPAAGVLPAVPPPLPTPTLATQGTLTGFNGQTIAYRSDGRQTLHRPTIVTLAMSGEQSLNPGWGDTALALVDRGWLAVSIDLPAHGADVRAGETSDPLSNWRIRIQNGEDIVETFTDKLTAAFDYLIATNLSDPSRLAAAGTSRGGFMAIHAAARDSRIRAVAAFVPVTDLTALLEFRGMDGNALTNRLKLTNEAPRLRHTPIWIVIGDNDTRVSTARCWEFARAVGLPPVEMHTGPYPEHGYPATAPREAADWIADRLR